ncbi:MAG: hypothetical protein ACI9U1_000844 [Porticoccaceae bacterium]|jgi:hypothetical protein
MNKNIKTLLDRIYELEQDLADDLHKQRDELLYEFNKGKVVFKSEIKLRNQALKIGIGKYVMNARWLVIATAPIIYSILIPIFLLDLFVTIYQAICFPVYGIPKVKRREFFVFDRVKLDYLNGIEKINCAYCSYGNGTIGYAREIAARSEQYWCPIKHARKVANRHSRYSKFTDFGNGEQYRNEYERIKKDF